MYDHELCTKPACRRRKRGEREQYPRPGVLRFVRPVRRAILERLDREPALVSELAEPFEISLQAVSRHIQVLVRAGLISQERTGRISRCSLEAGPVYNAAVWINRYSKYWQEQFDVLAVALTEIEENRDRKKPKGKKRR
ncbi:MAG: helix-turn-helix transcriptional regulator [Rhodospirillaceae bacterium]|nr:helix-turn-helix transcriptional regulator [Rhodospirillaceae bacterium]